MNASQASSTFGQYRLVRLARCRCAGCGRTHLPLPAPDGVHPRADARDFVSADCHPGQANWHVLAILALVSAAIVASIIYTLTMDKIREIAVLKLIGTKNRTIAAMILQQALALGLIGFFRWAISATFAAPLFPKYVLRRRKTHSAVWLSLGLCALASLVAIRMALRIDPRRSN